MNQGHVHVGGLTVLAVVAIIAITHVLVRTMAPKYPNSPFWQAMAFAF